MEEDDTCFVVKMKIQDQFGIPVSKIILAEFYENSWYEDARSLRYNYCHDYQEITEIDNEQILGAYKRPLFIVTEEELKADAARLKEEEKAWREEVRKEDMKPGRIEEKRKLGYEGME